MPMIVVTVAPGGETRMETHGFAGADCQQATRVFEAALGLVQSEQLTAEFYQGLPQETPLPLRTDTVP